MIRALYAGHPEQFDDYAPVQRAAFAEAGLDVDLRSDHPADLVDYIIYSPANALRDFSPFVRAKAVLSLWAGVERIVDNPTITQPLCRMVEPGLVDGMVEWVVGHTLRHHLDIDFALARQDGRWTRHVPPLARNRPVGILGLGELGTACALALAALNFPVSGWSRGHKAVEGVSCHKGSAGLAEVLSRSEILILLLPLTPLTRNVLNADTLALLPKGAVVLNPGRGALIDDGALLAALDSGRVRHATLDVFRVEPLPADDPYWTHPRVTVTPHVASETRWETAARVIAENVRRGEAGDAFLHVVDRSAGY